MSTILPEVKLHRLTGVCPAALSRGGIEVEPQERHASKLRSALGALRKLRRLFRPLPVAFARAQALRHESHSF